MAVKKKSAARRAPAGKKSAARKPARRKAAATAKSKPARKKSSTRAAARPAAKPVVKPALKAVPRPLPAAATRRPPRPAPAPASPPLPLRKRPDLATIPPPSGSRRISREAPPTESASFMPYVQKRGESYMNTAQVAHFRKILLDWKRSLMEEVDRTVHHMQDEASNFPDPNDRATQEEEFALELRTRDRERKLIKKIDESLIDLEKGDYGFCEICGVDIGIKRLEARPTATLCIDCKTLDEIKEKQLG